MLRIALCDDEDIICSQLENVLLALSKSLFIKIEVEIFNSGEKLCEVMTEGRYFDMIFLDIELHTITGVEIGKVIREEMKNEAVHIVYISGKDSYAMALFKIRPLDFLIKPLKEEKIEEVIRQAIRLSGKNNQFFEYKKAHIVHKVAIDNILYFESIGKKIRMVLQHDVDEFYEKLPNIEKQLTKYHFIRIHKSYLVNYVHVIEYQYDCVKISNQTILSISQQKRKLVRSRLLQLNQGEYSCELK